MDRSLEDLWNELRRFPAMQKTTGLVQSDPVALGSPQSWGISRHYSISCEGRNKAHQKSGGTNSVMKHLQQGRNF